MRFGRWDGTTDRTFIGKQDALAGFPSGFCRQYLDLFQSFTGSYIQFAADNGRIPVINIHSWTPAPRHAIQWIDVANGRYDSTLLQNFTDFAQLGILGYFVFHHEPENEEDGKTSGDLPAGESCGTRADFVLASGHVRDLMRSVLPNTQGLFGVTLMQGRYASGQWTQWMPPNYHFLGIDGYSHGNVNKNGVNTETFSSIFTPAHDAAVTAGRQLLIQECGVAETSSIPTFKRDWYREGRTLCKTWPELLGVEITNCQAKEDYRIDTSTASLTAFQAWAGDPFYQGAWT